MKSLSIALLLLAMLSGCCSDLPIDTPDCIAKKVRSFKRSTKCDNASVSSYYFQGKTVYVFSDGSCIVDTSSDVLDSDCNLLGALGGFVGNNVINGEPFSNATFIEFVWEK